MVWPFDNLFPSCNCILVHTFVHQPEKYTHAQDVHRVFLMCELYFDLFQACVHKRPKNIFFGLIEIQMNAGNISS
jgi:hypothetical protein